MRVLRLVVASLTFAVILVSPAWAQEFSAPPETLTSPIAGGWTLLVNTGGTATPQTLASRISPSPQSVFVFENSRFLAYRSGLPALSDLNEVRSGQAFWIFVPPSRLNGDLAFWQQTPSTGAQSVTLRPGFNLAAWTGTDGMTISDAVANLPVARAFFWDPERQAFLRWDPALPASVSTDFRLEYGAGLWLDLTGNAEVVWEQGLPLLPPSDADKGGAG